MLSFTLTRKGCWIKLEKDNIDELNKILKKYFTLRYMNKTTRITSIMKNYFTESGKLYLPRFKVEELIKNNKIEGTIINKLKLHKPNENINYIGQSNTNQLLVINYLMNNIYNRDNGIILKMMAGSGKTYLAMDIISRLKQKTLIIVPNTYLLEQWYELINMFFPNVKVGRYYSKYKEEGDIVIGIVNTIVITKTLDFKSFGLCVLDECHMYCTKMFKTIYNRINFYYMLGLSATPDIRIDGYDQISETNIGNILDVETLEGYNKLDNTFASTVYSIFYNGPDEYTETIVNDKNGMVDTIGIISNLIIDPNRNKLIIEQINRLLKLESNIFVFSDRRGHLEELYNLFVDTYTKELNINVSIPELTKSQILYGGSKKDSIETAKNESSVIFTTYKYSSTGVSINRLTGLILSTPRRSNMIQIINRIFRQADEYRDIHRYIIDIVDNKTVLKNQYYARKQAYKERESTIIESIIDFKKLE